jgi:hypothetical protein
MLSDDYLGNIRTAKAFAIVYYRLERYVCRTVVYDFEWASQARSNN